MRQSARTERSLEIYTSQLISRHAVECGWIPAPPIPVDLIAEKTCGLSITWDEFPEGVVGGLCVDTRQIILNEKDEVLRANVGRYRFTIAHEVAHWELHVDKAEPISLFEGKGFLYRDGGSSVIKKEADRYAAALLMPKDLVREIAAQYHAGQEEATLEIRREISDRFAVSALACQVRLRVLGYWHEEGSKVIWGNASSKQISFLP